MSKLTPEEKQKWDKRGGQDAAEGRSRFWHGPWGGGLEPHEHYEERQKAYNNAYDNASKQADCWVATALYGDPEHPNIHLLRRYHERENRNVFQAVARRSLGRWVAQVYVALGRSSFGEWWRQGLRANQPRSARRAITIVALKIVLSIARRSTIPS